MSLLRNTVKTNSGTIRSQSASAGKGVDMSEMQAHHYAWHQNSEPGFSAVWTIAWMKWINRN